MWSPPSAGSWTRVAVSSLSLSMDASTAFPTTTPGLPWTPWPGRGSWWQGMTDWLVTFQGLLHQHLQWLLPLCYFPLRLHLQRPSDQAGDGAEGEERGCGYLWYLLLLIVKQYTSESRWRAGWSCWRWAQVGSWGRGGWGTTTTWWTAGTPAPV